MILYSAIRDSLPACPLMALQDIFKGHLSWWNQQPNRQRSPKSKKKGDHTRSTTYGGTMGWKQTELALFKIWWQWLKLTMRLGSCSTCIWWILFPQPKKMSVSWFYLQDATPSAYNASGSVGGQLFRFTCVILCFKICRGTWNTQCDSFVLFCFLAVYRSSLYVRISFM